MTPNVYKLVRYTNLHRKVYVMGAYGFRVDNLGVPRRSAKRPKTRDRPTRKRKGPSRSSTRSRKRKGSSSSLTRSMKELVSIRPVPLAMPTTIVCTSKGELLFS